MELPWLAPIERLEDRVIRVLCANPHFLTLQGTKVYVVGQGASRVLMDTGDKEHSEQLVEDLDKVLREESCTIGIIVLTHWHVDHTGGLEAVRKRFPNALVYKGTSHDKPNYLALNHGQILKVEGASLQCFFTPGHADDHFVFLLRETNVLFSGDNILGHGSSSFTNLTQYLKSLAEMDKLDSTRMYPGHGQVVDKPRAQIKKYQSRRREREQQILEILRKYSPLTSSQLCTKVYADSDLPEPIRKTANEVVNLHVDKLVSENKILVGQSLEDGALISLSPDASVLPKL